MGKVRKEKDLQRDPYALHANRRKAHLRIDKDKDDDDKRGSGSKNRKREWIHEYVEDRNE